MITKLLVAASITMVSVVKAQGPDGGQLLSDDGFPPPSTMFDANGEFQLFLPGVPIGPRQPEPGLLVGFIDSGTTSTHPQLAGLVLEERSFVDGPLRDEIGHGTWTMLITFAPDPQKRIGFYSAKVTRDGSDLRAENVIKAFQWLVSKGVFVINMSLGFDQLTPDVKRLCDVIGRSNISVAAAAGNLGPDVKFYPAHCGVKNVVAVGEISQGKTTSTSGQGDVYFEPPKFLPRWAFLNERARQEFRDGHPDVAKSLWEQSIAAKENSEALHELALLLMHKGEWKEARPFVERAIALAPDVADGYQTLGAILYALEDDAGAIQQSERALELDPKNQPALLNLARSCIVTGQFRRAGEILDRAQANEPADERVAKVRAMLIERSGGRP